MSIDDEILALEGFRDLQPDWDGYKAAEPTPQAIVEAMVFLKRVDGLEATLHSDGSVLLEFRGGCLRFKGDGLIHGSITVKSQTNS